MKRLVAVLLGLAVAECAWGQDLAEAARREKERRQKAGQGAAKVVTDEELRTNRGQLANDPSIPPAAVLGAPDERPSRSRTAPAAGERASSASARSEQMADGSEAGWRRSVRSLRESIVRLEGDVATLDAKATSLAYGSASAGRRPNETDGARQLRQGINAMNSLAWQKERTEVLAKLASARASLDKAKADLADLEERARRQGVPPGWLRD